MSSTLLTVADLLPMHLAQLRVLLRQSARQKSRLQESSSDLVQSVCREALEAPPDVTFANKTQFWQWLVAIARTKLIDRYRRHAAQKRSPRGSGVPAELATDERPSPSDCVSHAEQLSLVESAILRLPEEQQKVIWMSRVLALPHSRIAEVLGRSEVSTRKLLSRAMAELGAQLALTGATTSQASPYSWRGRVSRTLRSPAGSHRARRS